MKKGSCYQSAGVFILDSSHLFSEDSLMLCHGIVVGTGGDVKGKHYGHAWIELDDKLVYDTETKKWVYKDIYYKVGNVHGVVRYTPSEAKERLLTSGTYGPWHKIDWAKELLHERQVIETEEEWLSVKDKSGGNGDKMG